MSVYRTNSAPHELVLFNHRERLVVSGERLVVSGECRCRKSMQMRKDRPVAQIAAGQLADPIG